MVSFEELPNIPGPSTPQATQQDLSRMRKWAKEYRRSLWQLTVRAKSTKDNLGTLPVTAYGRWEPEANSSFSLSEIRSNICVDSDIPTSDDEDDFDVDCVPVTMNCVPTITVSKGSTLLILHDERVSSPFLLGNWLFWLLSKYLIKDTPLMWHCLLTLASSFSLIISGLASSQRSFTVYPR